MRGWKTKALSYTHTLLYFWGKQRFPLYGFVSVCVPIRRIHLKEFWCRVAVTLISQAVESRSYPSRDTPREDRLSLKQSFPLFEDFCKWLLNTWRPGWLFWIETEEQDTAAEALLIRKKLIVCCSDDCHDDYANTFFPPSPQVLCPLIVPRDFPYLSSDALHLHESQHWMTRWEKNSVRAQPARQKRRPQSSERRLFLNHSPRPFLRDIAQMRCCPVISLDMSLRLLWDAWVGFP